MPLSDPEAFSALSDILVERTSVESDELANPAFRRLAEAMKSKSTSSLDIGILIRHALLNEGSRRNYQGLPTLPMPSSLKEEHLELLGLSRYENNTLSAADWMPDWLDTQEGNKSPDKMGAAAKQRRFGVYDEAIIADPFYRHEGVNTYRSVGQRAAIRSALLTPPGGTTIVDLPTGDGKSSIFRLIGRCGFASDPVTSWKASALTLVVVPTIALAYDHESNCRRYENDFLAYVGSGSERRKLAILDRIKNERSGLVFAAPEAVCGVLRKPLLEAAAHGKLRALIIDEAHLIDAWGTGFRSYFQILSGFRQELIESAPPELAPRTILLSATLSPETVETLTKMFDYPSGAELISASQVRPEPLYWVAKASSSKAERGMRVQDALLRLPRPLILYVTKVDDARDWEKRLRNLGFSRIASFHGETPDRERQRVLSDWTDGKIDTVVATSAFGLGIDYPNVRSVVHACIPETFDRFYQEVGRGGRDGCEFVSLIVPCEADKAVARSLSQETVISIERGLVRWKSMFQHPDSISMQNNRFELRLDVPPGVSESDIDMVGERNRIWNARVLTLMSRSGIIRLLGGRFLADDNRNEGFFQTVEILEPGHMTQQMWQDLVEPERRRIAKARVRNFNLMLERLNDDRCPSRQVLELYGESRVDFVCGGCRLCRADTAVRQVIGGRREPGSVWNTPSLTATASEIVGSANRLIVFYAGQVDASSRRQKRVAKAMMEGLWKGGFRSVLLLGSMPDLFSDGVKAAQDFPIFFENLSNPFLSRLPSGPRVIIVGQTFRGQLPMSAGDMPKILFVPDNFPDPQRPGQLLNDRGDFRDMSLDNFVESINR